LTGKLEATIFYLKFLTELIMNSKFSTAYLFSNY